MLVVPPVKMNFQMKTLIFPHDATKAHPLYPKLRLIAIWLSCVRETLQSQGITGEALSIIIDS